MSSTESEMSLWWNWVPRCILEGLRQVNGHGFEAKDSSICMNQEGEGSSGDGCNVVDCCWWLEKMQKHWNEHGEGSGICYCECEVNVSMLWF